MKLCLVLTESCSFKMIFVSPWIFHIQTDNGLTDIYTTNTTPDITSDVMAYYTDLGQINITS